MMSILRSVRAAKVAAFKPTTHIGSFAMIHSSKLVDLHETLHPTRKEELSLRGLRLHTCPGKEPCNTCAHNPPCWVTAPHGPPTATIDEIAEQLKEDKVRALHGSHHIRFIDARDQVEKQTTTGTATHSTKNKNQRPASKTLEAAMTGINPFTGKKMTLAEMERAFGL